MNAAKNDPTALDLDDSGEALRHAVDAALSSGYETVARTSSTIIVKKCLDIIERYRNDGLTFAQIAQFISEKVAPVTEMAIKKAYGREIKARSVGAPCAAAPPPSTQGAKKEVEQQTAPAPTLVTAPTQPATAPAHAPAKPTPLPDIPNRELTQTEREAIAVPWFAERFGGRNAVHVKVEEVSAAEMDWLERLWDLSAPVNPKTGQAYRIKSFTAVGRPIYDRPSPPPAGTMPVEGGVGDYTHVFVDDDLRSSMAKYGARIARKTGPPGMRIDDDSLQVLFPDGHRSVSFPAYSVNGILRGMMPDIMNNWVKVRNAAPAVVSTG